MQTMTRKQFEDELHTDVVVDAGNRSVSFVIEEQERNIVVSKSITTDALSILANSDADAEEWRKYSDEYDTEYASAE